MKQQAIQEARKTAQAAKLEHKELQRAAITQKMGQILSEAQRKWELIDNSNKAEAEERADKDAALRQLKREEMWKDIDRCSQLSRYHKKLL